MNKVKIHDLEKVLEPLFYNWKRKRQSKESFGDFTNRVVSIEITTLQVIISQPIRGKVSFFMLNIYPILLKISSSLKILTSISFIRDLKLFKSGLRNGMVWWLHGPHTT
jgi:hypothetical protein